MAFKIEISPTAIQDIEATFLLLKSNSPDQAFRWMRSCYEKLLTLEQFPLRCPKAREADYLGIDIRQLLYANKYRVLFTVTTDDVDDSGTVHIHRVIHHAKQQFDRSSQLFGD